MKILKILFAFAILSFVSCEKDLQLLEVENITPTISSDYYTFKTVDDFDSYLKAKPSDRRTFLDQLTFTTYSQYLDNLLDEIDENSTEKEILQFVNKYSDLFKIETNADGYKSVETRERTNSILNRISNANGIFVVENHAYKKIENSLVEAKLELIDNLSALTSSDLETLDKNLFSVYEQRPSKVITRALGSYSCGADNNNSGCNNDRRIEIEVYFDEVVFPGLGTVLFKNVDVIAKRKNWSCYEYKYRTVITLNSIDFESLTHDNVTHTWVINNSITESNTKTLTVSIDIGEPAYDDYDTEPGFVEKDIVSLDVSATHQGMAGDDLECGI